MNPGITRKDFLRFAVLGTAGLSVIPSLAIAAAAPATKPKAKMIYRLEPLAGKKYSPSFLNFCQRSRFASAKEAVRRVKDRSFGYRLVAQPV